MISLYSICETEDGHRAVFLSQRVTFDRDESGASVCAEDAMVLFPDRSIAIVNPATLRKVEGAPSLPSSSSLNMGKPAPAVGDEWLPYAVAFAAWRAEPGELRRARLAEMGYDVLGPAAFVRSVTPAREAVQRPNLFGEVVDTGKTEAQLNGWRDADKHGAVGWKPSQGKLEWA